jgi:hypothetical protein
MSTDISEKHIASIFTVEKIIFPPAFTLVSSSAYFFYPEKGGDMFLRNQNTVLFITTAVRTSKPTNYIYTCIRRK